jgi:diguanylate cyclase (GGDEF)-like protein
MAPRAGSRTASVRTAAQGRALLVAEDDAKLGDTPFGHAARREILSATLRLSDAALDDLAGSAGEQLLDRLVDLASRVRRLESEAALDDLTGALRRGVGLRLLQAEIDRVRRADGRLVVAFVDVDGLKGVNDGEGHAAGDRLLQQVSQTLRRRLRSYDLVIRYGGDEFVCTLSGARAEEAGAKFALIAAELNGMAGQPAISVGLAELDGDDDRIDTAATLVARADAALYQGRDRTRLAR